LCYREGKKTLEPICISPPEIMSSPSPAPVPLLRPPIPGQNRSGSGTRTPRLGLSIPPSPSQKPVSGVGSVPELPSLQRPPSRSAAPQLRLATPQGSNSTPSEIPFSTSRPSALQIGTSIDDDLAKKGSFGSVQEGRLSGPNSASSASHSALSFANGIRQNGTSDPTSAISSVYSHDGTEREGSSYNLPDLEKLSLDKGREIDVEDLDDEGWMAASAQGRIIELGTLGEGAGGAVTKCKLKGGKTIFALKVWLFTRSNSYLPNSIRSSQPIPIQKCRNK
jgi:mitogen-activated protein kinase kinase